MELRPGYKKTDIGVIPENWRVGSISTVAEVKTGPFGSSLHERDYVNDGTPIITVEHLGELGIIHRNLPMVSDTDKARLKSYVLRKNDIVFSRVGSVDRNSLVSEAEEGWLFSGRLLRVRASEAFVCPRYLSYYFHTEPFKHRVRSVAVGQTMASLNTQILKGICVALPPDHEQDAIANTLRDVDELMVTLDKLIAKKRDLKEAAVQQLVTGRMRLPGFSAPWESTTLGQIGECVIGLTYKPENVVRHGILVLRSSNIQDGRLAFEDNVYVNVKVPEHLITRQGDILVCVRNGSRALIGKCAMIDERAAGETFGAFMSVYRTKYSQFVFHAFQAYDIQRQIRDNIGATINQITNKDMKALRVMLPSVSEQTAISEVLSDMDAEIAALEKRSEKTRMLKRAMMQELLTGKTLLI